MKKKSIITAVIISVVFLIGIVLTLIFYPIEQAYISPSDACYPSSCPSGYQDLGVTCDLYGTDYDCERECYRPAGCGSYGSYSSRSNTVSGWDGSSDRGDYFYSPSVYMSDSYCWRFYGQAYFVVSGWGSADSYIIRSYRDGSGGQSKCSTYANDDVASTSRTLTPGDRSDHRGWGSVYDYGGSDCSGGTPLNDLEGTLYAYIYYSSATYNQEDTLYRTCSGSVECEDDSDCGSDGYTGSSYCSGGDVYQTYRTWDCSSYQCDYSDSGNLIQACSYGCSGGSCIASECTSGQTKCEGNDYYTCVSDYWSIQGPTVGECGVECLDASDCTIPQICSNYNCITPTYVALNITVINVDIIPLTFTIVAASPTDFESSLTIPDSQVVQPNEEAIWITDMIDISGYTTKQQFTIQVEGTAAYRETSTEVASMCLDSTGVVTC